MRTAQKPRNLHDNNAGVSGFSCKPSGGENHEPSFGGRLDTKVVAVEGLLLPVSEATSVPVGTTTEVDNQTEDDKSDDSHDFDALYRKKNGGSRVSSRTLLQMMRLP